MMEFGTVIDELLCILRIAIAGTFCVVVMIWIIAMFK